MRERAKKRERVRHSIKDFSDTNSYGMFTMTHSLKKITGKERKRERERGEKGEREKQKGREEKITREKRKLPKEKENLVSR